MTNQIPTYYYTLFWAYETTRYYCGCDIGGVAHRCGVPTNHSSNLDIVRTMPTRNFLRFMSSFVWQLAFLESVGKFLQFSLSSVLLCVKILMSMVSIDQWPSTTKKQRSAHPSKRKESTRCCCRRPLLNHKRQILDDVGLNYSMYATTHWWRRGNCSSSSPLHLWQMTKEEGAPEGSRACPLLSMSKQMTVLSAMHLFFCHAPEWQRKIRAEYTYYRNARHSSTFSMADKVVFCIGWHFYGVPR